MVQKKLKYSYLVVRKKIYMYIYICTFTFSLGMTYSLMVDTWFLTVNRQKKSYFTFKIQFLDFLISTKFIK